MEMMGGVFMGEENGRVDLSVSRSRVVAHAPGSLRGRWVRLNAAPVCTLAVYTLRASLPVYTLRTTSIRLRWLD